MVAINFLHVNAGNGEISYANNSLAQKKIILKARAFLEEAIRDRFVSAGFPSCVKLAELGCSSGTNALLAISEIIDTIHEMSQRINCESPEFQVFLNDLPETDFNNIFKSLPAFYEGLMKEKGGKLGNCFVTGMPGSFYGRIFPTRSLDFVHSSASVHWLSQVPAGLKNNKGHIYMANTCRPDVLKAYTKQFQRDFTMFLGLRSEEIKPGGRMVITITGRSIEDPSSKDCCDLWELLAKSLLDMLADGLVEEADVDSFNLPMYNPFEGEVKALIEEEGSFNLDKLETFEASWDPYDDSDKPRSGQNVANCIRSATEPMLATHFGDAIIPDLFARYANRVADHLSMEKGHHFLVVFSLTKK
ncbi:hypothetical protein AAG906_033159 [Vitis piasezkii]